VLHTKLTNHGCEGVAERPDESRKVVLALSARHIVYSRARVGQEGGETCRMLHLCFRNGVDGVVGVDHEAD
jgi:hypothetical protein